MHWIYFERQNLCIIKGTWIWGSNQEKTAHAKISHNASRKPNITEDWVITYCSFNPCLKEKAPFELKNHFSIEKLNVLYLHFLYEMRRSEVIALHSLLLDWHLISHFLVDSSSAFHKKKRFVFPCIIKSYCFPWTFRQRLIGCFFFLFNSWISFFLMLQARQTRFYFEGREGFSYLHRL